jgi:hypothetical protein
MRKLRPFKKVFFVCLYFVLSSSTIVNCGKTSSFSANGATASTGSSASFLSIYRAFSAGFVMLQA